MAETPLPSSILHLRFAGPSSYFQVASPPREYTDGVENGMANLTVNPFGYPGEGSAQAFGVNPVKLTTMGGYGPVSDIFYRFRRRCRSLQRPLAFRSHVLHSWSGS